MPITLLASSGGEAPVALLGNSERRATWGASVVFIGVARSPLLPGYEGLSKVCLRAFPPRPLQEVMDEMVQRLVNDTVALLEAVARGDTHNAWVLADRLRMSGWKRSMPGLASAAGAFQHSLESGPSSEVEMALAVQAIAFEMRDVVRSSA